jgi:hypothetical protein
MHAIALARRPSTLSGVFRLGTLLATAALLLGPVAVDARSALGAGESVPDQALIQPLPAELGPADLGQVQELLSGRLALLEVAPRLDDALAIPGLLEPVVLQSPILSGLDWRSGIACGAGADTWRNRDFDTGWSGIGKKSWSTMLSAAKSGTLRDRAESAPQPVIALPLLPQEADGELPACAEGDFDQQFRDIGAALHNNKAGHAVIRLGKEANRGRSAFGYDSDDDLPHYIGCFQHAAAALKETAPELKIEWTNARQTLSPVNPLDAYPGDDAVDIVGVHYYDNPTLGRMTTQEIWDQLYVQSHSGGGPQGLGLWLDFAKSRDKKLAVSEWGLWGNNPGAADNVVYIENMYRFFNENADDLEYESYYNCATKHKIYPILNFPNASARYQELWSAGQ